ncbi:MAG TPA: hypothetical protein VF059_10665 [Casimicrobiaceae bacterium]
MRNAPPSRPVERVVADRRGRAALAKAALAAFCTVAAAPGATENWILVGGSRIGSSLAVDVDSVQATEGFPARLGVWLHYTYPTSIDCAPPRGCLAASQRVYAIVDCPAQVIAPVQRISMDLNGNVVARSDVGTQAPRYLARAGSFEGAAWSLLCPGYPDRLELREDPLDTRR